MKDRREQKPKTIGKSTRSRGTWTVDPREKVVPAKKGKKKPYKRDKKIKHEEMD